MNDEKSSNTKVFVCFKRYHSKMFNVYRNNNYNKHFISPEENSFDMFNDLPTEVWQQIFTKIPKREGVNILKLRLVSKKWNNMLMNLFSRNIIKINKSICGISIHKDNFLDGNKIVYRLASSNSISRNDLFFTINDLGRFLKMIYVNALIILNSRVLNEITTQYLCDLAQTSVGSMCIKGKLCNKDRDKLMQLIGNAINLKNISFVGCDPEDYFFNDTFVTLSKGVENFFLGHFIKKNNRYPKYTIKLETVLEAIHENTDYFYIENVSGDTRNIQEKAYNDYPKLKIWEKNVRLIPNLADPVFVRVFGERILTIDEMRNSNWNNLVISSEAGNQNTFVWSICFRNFSY